jgi:hypothetical protein
MSAVSAELNLPDPLIANDGTVIDSREKWEQIRRPEILELFREHVYGRRPSGFVDKEPFGNTVAPRVINSNHYITDTFNLAGGAVRMEKIRTEFDTPNGKGELNLIVMFPSEIKEPFSVPAFLLICHRDPENIDPSKSNGFWPWEEIVRRGYVAAAFWTGDIDPDEHDGFKNGVHGLFDDQSKPRGGDAWGTISAWGWGASMCMDYLSGSKWIDAGKIAVIGHSRGGKTALWAGAEDPRFGMIISNESGNSGAALARRMKGETIAKINKGFPHWFNKNYKKFNDNEFDLPVDQHMLAALVAPRLLYIGSAQEDTWADPEGEYLSAVHAAPVYNLYGHKGLVEAPFPKADQPIHGDRVAYHIRSGKHNLTEYDWGQYMDFADKYWK